MPFTSKKTIKGTSKKGTRKRRRESTDDNVMITDSERRRNSDEAKGWLDAKKLKTNQKRNGSSSADSTISDEFIQRCLLHDSIRQQFIIIEEIGSGSYGTVFKVKSIADKKIYALKLIRLKKTDERTKRECEVLSALIHDSVVRYHHSFYLPSKSKSHLKGKKSSVGEFKVLCIQMEYCDQTLQHFIDSKTLQNDKKMRCNILREISSGVKYIQEKNLLHRDLKPTNIFLDKSGHVKIGDFGFARWDFDTSTGDTESKISLLSSGLGSRFYCSPEIRSGNKNYTNKVDLYSLGVIIFEICYPFQTGKSRENVLTDLTERYSFPKDFKSKINDNMRKVISGLLKHDPKKRSTIESVIEMLSHEDDDSNDEREQQSESCEPLTYPDSNVQKAVYVIASKEKGKDSYTRRSLGFRIGNSYLLTALSGLRKRRFGWGLRVIRSSSLTFPSLDIVWSSVELDSAILKLPEDSIKDSFDLKELDTSKSYKVFDLVHRKEAKIITSPPFKILTGQDNQETYYFDYTVDGITKGSPIFEVSKTGFDAYGIVLGDLFDKGKKVGTRFIKTTDIYQCLDPIVPENIRSKLFRNLASFQMAETYFKMIEQHLSKGGQVGLFDNEKNEWIL